MSLHKTLNQNGGQPGHLSVEQVKAYHPWSRQSHVLYQSGSTLADNSIPSISIQDGLRLARLLNSEHITLEFIPSLSLMDREHFVKQPLLHPC